MEDALGRPHSPAWLHWCVAGSQVLGLAVLFVTGAWMAHYRGGFAWEGNLQFNLHPLCMVIGMVFLCGDALLVYRVFRNEKKRVTKILHGTLHVFAFVIALIGIIAVFDYHKKQNITDMYSLHSWCGIITFTLFFVQWIIGLVFFLFPGFSIYHRSYYKPLHVFFGVTLLVMAIGTSLLGIKEKLLFTFSSDYSHLPAEAVLANSLGLLLIAFGVAIGFIVTRDEWKRPILPEEQALSMDFKTLTEGSESPGEQ
ncbi:transmembrane ascorbate-dependent reductase CYB561 [Microcaecilia unicolor]|uniref:Transmembrane ascorbate-dependent reductase CYB561 n=1 Tax=Microcaecilia unicolor TaxID=1415580 RepID=A0A6P7ZC29_9AMPH|nr:cytochrome b561 [Microcaecilia unicolor]XP_030076872.1 cytochrome b561 [Microcaecilia unicolor]